MKGSCEHPRPSVLISSGVKINSLSKEIIYLSEMVLTTFISDILCIWFPKEECHEFYQVGWQLLFSCIVFKTRSSFRNVFLFWDIVCFKICICIFFEELLAMLFFLREFRENKSVSWNSPFKLPVYGLALLLPEPEDERHPVRTCRWRYIARQPRLWQQTKTKL